jgi:hypothetical protein
MHTQGSTLRHPLTGPLHTTIIMVAAIARSLALLLSGRVRYLRGDIGRK